MSQAWNQGAFATLSERKLRALSLALPLHTTLCSQFLSSSLLHNQHAAAHPLLTATQLYRASLGVLSWSPPYGVKDPLSHSVA